MGVKINYEMGFHNSHNTSESLGYVFFPADLPLPRLSSLSSIQLSAAQAFIFCITPLLKSFLGLPPLVRSLWYHSKFHLPLLPVHISCHTLARHLCSSSSTTVNHLKVSCFLQWLCPCYPLNLNTCEMLHHSKPSNPM